MSYLIESLVTREELAEELASRGGPSEEHKQFTREFGKYLAEVLLPASPLTPDQNIDLILGLTLVEWVARKKAAKVASA